VHRPSPLFRSHLETTNLLVCVSVVVFSFEGHFASDSFWSENPERSRLLGKHSRRWNDNIQVDLKEIECEL
jgi:hypothetical protein